MALINCPNCGQSISDKATECPHCNFQTQNNTVTCSECKAQYSSEQGNCPVCGCPKITVQNKNVPQKKKHKGIVITAIILAVVFTIGLLGTFVINNGKAAVYYYNLETVTYKMLDGAADAEAAGNLIKSVWYNAIYEKHDAGTDKYTVKNGRFVNDFNDALDSLFSDKDFLNDISAIKDNQDEVTSLMKQLVNPPKKYKEAYSVLKTYYENYLLMTNTVIYPTGSLQSFSDEFNKSDDETVNSFEKMKLYLD